METRQIRLLQPLPVRLERVLLMQARTRSCQATCQKPERAVVEVGCSGGYGGQGSQKVRSALCDFNRCIMYFTRLATA